MSLLSKFFRKSDPDSGSGGTAQAGWPWTLTVDGAPVGGFTWADVRRELGNLIPDQDSFLILERKNPADQKQYWYIQSAIATAGEHARAFVVGIGYSTPEGPALFERYEDTFQAVIPWFEAAWQERPLDLSQFEDHSAWLRR